MNLPLVGAHFYSVHSKLAQEKLLHKTWKRVNKSHICHEDCNNCQSHKHFQAESGGFNTDSLSWAPAAPHSTLPHPGPGPGPGSFPCQPASLRGPNNFAISKEAKNMWRKPLTKTTEVLSQRERKLTKGRGATWETTLSSHIPASKNLVGNNPPLTQSPVPQLFEKKGAKLLTCHSYPEILLQRGCGLFSVV